MDILKSIFIHSRQFGKTAFQTEIMKKKLADMQQINGKFSPTKLEDIVKLECNNPRCAQVHFGREIDSICPDCKRGTLETK